MVNRIGRATRLGALLLALVLPQRAAATPAIDGPPSLLLARAIAHYRADELLLAVVLLKRVHGAEPRNLAAGHYLGLALIRLGDKKEGRRALKRTARAHPQALRLQFDLGLAYLAEGNAGWATRTLARARSLAEKSGQSALLRQIRYYEGVAQLRSSNGRAAARALRDAAPPPGISADELRLRRAIAHQLSGEFQRARSLAADVGGSLRPLGQRLLRSAYGAQGINASFISWQLLAEFLGDSNPLYEHETTVQGSPALAFGASATLRPWIGSRSRLGASLSARTMAYLAHAEPGPGPEQANSYQLAADTFVAHRLAGTARPIELSIGYSFSLVGLRGDPPLADPNGIFLEKHAGQLSMAFAAGGNDLRLNYRLGRTGFARRVRSNWSQELSLWLTRTTLANRLQAIGWLAGRSEIAEGQHYEALIPGAGVGAAFLAPLKLLLGARFGYEWRDYYASESAYDGVWRQDHVLDLTLELSRTFGKHLTPRLVYRYLRNVSSVTTFDYQRHLVALQLIWRVD